MHPDRELAALADRQHGVVATWQLELPRHAFVHRRRTGRLYRIHQGVYAVGRRKLSREGHWMAAVLAYGPGTVLSHRSAAALWGLYSSGSKIDVTLAAARRSRTGIRAHRAPLHDEEATRLNGIPVTSVARTILDLAAVLNPDRLTRAIEEADRRELFDLRAADRAITRRPKARAAKALKRVLAGYRPTLDTKSALERDFLQLVRDAGLPEPSVNCLVEGFEVDIHWPQWRLVVELDGRGYHSSPRAFETDRVKDTVLQRKGRRVMRVTRKRLDGQPLRILEDIEALRRLRG